VIARDGAEIVEPQLDADGAPDVALAPQVVADAIKMYGIDPDKPNPVTV